MTSRPKLAAIVESPIQYHAPLFRHIAADGRLDLKVFFLTDRGVKPFQFHGTTVTHDKSLLDGYEWKQLRNISPLQNTFGFFDSVDPELYGELQRGGFSAAWFHGYNLASMWLGFAACKRAGIPILLRGESEDFFPRPPATRAAKRAVLGQLFRHVDAFLYIGQCNREFYENYGVEAERLFNVPYGVDNAWFLGEPGDRQRWRAEVRAEHGLSAKTMVFLNTSKHRHPKRPRDAVEAFCKLSPDLDIALMMVGDGELRADAEGAFAEYGRGHRVIFAGLRPYADLRRYLAASDVLVFPSIENWGMAINEAIAGGLAIITSDQVAGWFDMVLPGVNGLVYRAASIPALTANLRVLASRPLLVESMRAASLERAATLGFDRMTDGIVRAVEYANAHGPRK